MKFKRYVLEGDYLSHLRLLNQLEALQEQLNTQRDIDMIVPLVSAPSRRGKGTLGTSFSGSLITAHTLGAFAFTGQAAPMLPESEEDMRFVLRKDSIAAEVQRPLEMLSLTVKV